MTHDPNTAVRRFIRNIPRIVEDHMCGGTEDVPLVDRDGLVGALTENAAALDFSPSRPVTQEAGAAAYWALWSSSGKHIGLWTDRALAEQAAAGFPEGYRIEPLFKAPPSLRDIDDQLAALMKERDAAEWPEELTGDALSRAMDAYELIGGLKSAEDHVQIIWQAIRSALQPRKEE